jgi:hypothetical protein
MSTNEAVTAQAGPPSAADDFVKDAGGRTSFYPFGKSARGYAVPDAEREQALRAVMRRYRDGVKRIAPFAALLIAPGAFGFYYLLSSHPFLALGALVLPVVLAIACERLFLRYQLARLLAGLERVDGLDKTSTRRRQGALLILAGVATLTWLILRLYRLRIDSLPVLPGATTYYAGISLPLALAFVFGLFLFAIVFGWRSIAARTSENRALLGLFVLTVLELCCIGYVALNFLNPAPKIIVTRDALVCRNWRVRWSNVTDLTQFTGRRGAQYAWVKIGDEPQTSLWSNGNSRRCEVTGLNVDYDTVYQAMFVAWQNARGAPRLASTGDAKLDRIQPGANRKQVIALLGAPTRSGNTPDGQIAFYYADPEAENATQPRAGADRGVIAIYFDTNERVRRIGRYRVRDGKIFDTIGNTDLSGGAIEFPILHMILFEEFNFKPRSEHPQQPRQPKR